MRFCNSSVHFDVIRCDYPRVSLVIEKILSGMLAFVIVTFVYRLNFFRAVKQNKTWIILLVFAGHFQLRSGFNLKLSMLFTSSHRPSATTPSRFILNRLSPNTTCHLLHFYTPSLHPQVIYLEASSVVIFFPTKTLSNKLRPSVVIKESNVCV